MPALFFPLGGGRCLGCVIFIWNSGHETSITLLPILPKLTVTKETNTLKICCLKGRGLLFSSFQREKLTHCVPIICFKGEKKLIFRRLNESSSNRNSQANDDHPSMAVTVGILNSNSTLSRMFVTCLLIDDMKSLVDFQRMWQKYARQSGVINSPNKKKSLKFHHLQ